MPRVFESATVSPLLHRHPMKSSDWMSNRAKAVFALLGKELLSYFSYWNMSEFLFFCFTLMLLGADDPTFLPSHCWIDHVVLIEAIKN